MIINCNYLKKFLKNYPQEGIDWREVLPRLGIETILLESFEDDPRLEIEITPNRVDCLSHYGIAREIAARFDAVEFEPIPTKKLQPVKKTEWNLKIENSDDCFRYSYAVLTGLKVRPSSQKLQKLITSLGMRSINNLVDISNLAMVTLGHPVHFFDLDKLENRTVIIRRAKRGENIILLDESRVELDADYLVIADAQKPAALAGVMGGLDSGVTEKTNKILIESAMFNPLVVRRMVRKSGIHTDASYRFERGMDFNATVKAIELILTLLQEEEVDYQLEVFEDCIARKEQEQLVEFDFSFLERFSGITIAEEKALKILTKLGFTIEQKNNCWLVKVPSFRSDIGGKEDIVEELLRVHGYDNLHADLPEIAVRETLDWKKRENLLRLQDFLFTFGFSEAYNFVFQSAERNRLFADDLPLELENPLGTDFAQLRTSLLPNLLNNVRLNLNNFATRVMLFEYGRKFFLNQNSPQESEVIALVAGGTYQEKNWIFPEKKVDYFVFKSLLYSLFKNLRIDCEFREIKKNFFKEGSAFRIELNGEPAGFCGEFTDRVLNDFDIHQPVFGAEFTLDIVLKQIREREFVAWSNLPFIRRDFSFLISRNQPFQQLWEYIEKSRPEWLEKFQLLERYQPKGAEADSINYLIAFYYRDKQRTLTDEEVNQKHLGFVRELTEKFNLTPR